MSSNLCVACQAKPKYFDGKKTHPYCSKGCAKSMCDYCHQKPKYDDGQTTHPFCGKKCAEQAKSTGNAPAKSQNSSCLLCGKSVKKGHFCDPTCILSAQNSAPRLIEVPNTHDTYQSGMSRSSAGRPRADEEIVSNQFKSSWRHKTTCPTVRQIYKIIETSASIASYNAYKDSVEARGKFVTKGRSAGNENRRWHGTTRECLLGDNGNTTLCSSQTCSLCGIIRTSYRLDLFGKKTGWGRFGRGIYTSSTSSKSNDYSKNIKSSNRKTIILNKVVVGKGYKMSQDDTTRTAPPRGFDSVLGEVTGGGVLNYDELVSYSENAIRPSYLVTYDA